MQSNTYTKILLRKQVVERIGYSVVHIYRLMDKGIFPKQIRLGENRVGWLESEIEAWLAEKIATRDAENWGAK